MIYTIDSDDEVPVEIDDEEDTLEIDKRNSKKAKKEKKNKAKSSAQSFKIEFDTGDIAPLPSVRRSSRQKAEDTEDDDEAIEDKVKKMNAVEQRIIRNQKKQKNAKSKEEDAKDEGVEDEAEIQDQDKSAKMVIERDEEEDDDEIGMNREDEQRFFEEIVSSSSSALPRSTSLSSSGREQSPLMFSQLNLSRPFLRAIEALGFTSPTPIQAQVIPFALAGRDVCASAVTGSGKTAAFLLPCLERLLYRPKDLPAIRVLVVTPTRELAQQIAEVAVRLAAFSDITSSLISGGKRDVRLQETQLRAQPDIVICTPGRMLDHLRNTRSVSLELLNVLILDEADRLLELGFQEELEELIRYCPHSRQTMLFSATMTPSIEDLIRLSLKRPVRVKTETLALSVAPRLVQEFLKVKDSKDVEAILLALVHRSFHDRAIVFFELKKSAHRFCTLLNLLNVKASELHGDLPQIQRAISLDKFRTGEVEVLVATDVAARGLDIPNVQTVINAEMPRNASIYIHRVGRTARAGCGGRAITLVSDERRKIMKEVLKHETKKLLSGSNESPGNKENALSPQILSRTIPASVISHYSEKIASLESEVERYLSEEWERRRIDVLESKADKAQNLLLYREEIQSRPARTWFQTETQKKSIREQVKAQIEREKESMREEEQRAQEEEKQEAEGDNSLTAADRAMRALASRDDYRIEEDDKEGKKFLDKLHRMSRKKRRRLEAIKASQEADEEAGKPSPSSDALIKKAKSQLREKEKQKLGNSGKSAGEIAMKRVTVVEEEVRKRKSEFDDDGADFEDVIQKKKKSKVVRQTFAFGGLDQDIQNESSSSAMNRSLKKKKSTQDPHLEDWKEFDPNKRLRKGGKIGTTTFKSKKRYKRRK